MHFIHQWTKWKQYKREYTHHQFFTDGREPMMFPTSMLREQRVCSICGKMQDREVTTIADIQDHREESK